jgi:hypothetical protein
MTYSRENPGLNTQVCKEIMGGYSRIVPALTDDLPAIGMNLPYMENLWGICQTKEFDEAIRIFTKPPRVDIGLRYPHVPGGGELRCFTFLAQAWWCGCTFDGQPDADWPEFDGLTGFEQLQPLMPRCDLPEGAGEWVSTEHFTLLRRYIVGRGIDISAIHPPKEQP